MKFIAINDIKSLRSLRARLKEEGELVLTTNGNPVAIILDLQEGEDPEAALSAVRSARSHLALRRIREAARKAGTDRMPPKEIDRIISRVRADRRGNA